MALLTQTGQTALAVSHKAQILHRVWGTGDPAWESTFTQLFSFNNGRIHLHSVKTRSLFVFPLDDNGIDDGKTDLWDPGFIHEHTFIFEVQYGLGISNGPVYNCCARKGQDYVFLS